MEDSVRSSRPLSVVELELVADDVENSIATLDNRKNWTMFRWKKKYVHQHGIVGGFILGVRGVDLKVLDGGDGHLPLMLDALVAAGTGGVGGHFVN